MHAAPDTSHSPFARPRHPAYDVTLGQNLVLNQGTLMLCSSCWTKASLLLDSMHRHRADASICDNNSSTSEEFARSAEAWMCLPTLHVLHDAR